MFTIITLLVVLDRLDVERAAVGASRRRAGRHSRLLVAAAVRVYHLGAHVGSGAGEFGKQDSGARASCFEGAAASAAAGTRGEGPLELSRRGGCWCWWCCAALIGWHGASAGVRSFFVGERERGLGVISYLVEGAA